MAMRGLSVPWSKYTQLLQIPVAATGSGLRWNSLFRPGPYLKVSATVSCISSTVTTKLKTDCTKPCPAVPHFSTCSVLHKVKKHAKYDPNYIKRPTDKKKKQKEFNAKLGMKDITWENEEGDMTEMSSAQLEEMHAPLPDEDTLIEAFRIKSEARSGELSRDAEVSLRALVNKYPKLKQLDGAEFVKYMEFMTMYGFHPEQAVQMGLRHLPLFSTYNKRVNDTMITWRSLGYTEKATKAMLHYYPQLVDLDSYEARTRFAFLHSFFSREETMFAILNCVNVLYDHESILRKKLDYLIKNVCHTTKSIVRSMALAHSLKHIKLRHEFLVRAGLFQKSNYYAQHKEAYMLHPKVARNKYFPPDSVVCTSDVEFLKVCTDNMLTLNEFAAFEELYEKELEREKLLMSDDEEEGGDGAESEGESEDEEDEDAENILSPAMGNNNSSAFFSKKDSSDFYY